MSEYCDRHGKHMPLMEGGCPECRIAELEARLEAMEQSYSEGIEYGYFKAARSE